MEYKLTFDVSAAIYVKNPADSELGKKIVKSAIDLMYQTGFESFTFKKLAIEIGTTEASVYRYFTNKHRLLLYIINWYWYFMDFLFEMHLMSIVEPGRKLEKIIELMTHELPDSAGGLDYNKKFLHEIVVSESSKVYLVKNVDEINKGEVYKPYKELCAKIATVINQYDPDYPFPVSLSSTIIETAHHQEYFTRHLKRLTDSTTYSTKDFAGIFVRDMVFKILIKR